MNTGMAYDRWASQYDTNENKTRDLEGLALREMLSDIEFSRCLEMGCGTGKNTGWLLQKAKQVTAVDLSTEMLAIAREKIKDERVDFVQADMSGEWTFVNSQYDLVGFSLVLEHIEALGPIIRKANAALHAGGYLYIGELHPFKQYKGSRARFDTDTGREVLVCYDHHLSDFSQAAIDCGFQLITLNEYFDEDDRRSIPRILALLFRKP
ncbi:MAG: class I SAM-dependent methyltransferase [Chitinophagales bacterium]